MIIGFIDNSSPIGKLYEEHKDRNLFYNVANFYSAHEVLTLLRQKGFKDFNFTQTIFHSLAEVNRIEPPRKDYGEGSFVVVSAIK